MAEREWEHIDRRWPDRIAVLLAIAVGLGLGIALMFEDIPPAGGVGSIAITETHSTTKSGCAEGCQEPETTDAATTVETSLPEGAGGQSLLERALDNDVGVLLARILFILFAAVVTLVAAQRLIAALLDGWSDGSTGPPAEIPPIGPSGTRGGTEGEPPEADDESASTAVASNLTVHRRPCPVTSTGKSKHYTI